MSCQWSPTFNVLNFETSVENVEWILIDGANTGRKKIVPRFIPFLSFKFFVLVDKQFLFTPTELYEIISNCQRKYMEEENECFETVFISFINLNLNVFIRKILVI